MKEKCKVDVKKLTREYDLSQVNMLLPFLQSGTFIGQDKARNTLDFGLNMKGKEHHIYVMGTPTEDVVKYCQEKAGSELPQDICYVHDFDNPTKPKMLVFPAGEGLYFKSKIDRFIDTVQEELPKAFAGIEYESKKASLAEEYQKDNAELLKQLKEYAVEKKCAVTQIQKGFSVEGEGDKIAVSNRVSYTLNAIKINEKLLKEEIKALDEATVSGITDTPGYCFTGLERELRDFLFTNLDKFKTSPCNLLEPFRVNLFVYNSETEKSPVIYEANPTYANLFGEIEYIFQASGVPVTDISRIKPGALHRANGGVLILDVAALLTNQHSWYALARCIQSGKIQLEDVKEGFKTFPMVQYIPEAIPFDVKIVLVGSQEIRDIMLEKDPYFSQFFKVFVHFGMPEDATVDKQIDFALKVRKYCEDNKLLPFSLHAICRLTQLASREVEDQKKLSFKIPELVKEASYWAEKSGSCGVGISHVKKAEQEYWQRNNVGELSYREITQRGKMLISTDGYKVGQINGLGVVMGKTGFKYGVPHRITANTYAGNGNVIDIEREVKQSGMLHEKAVFILSSYLRKWHASEKPLSLSASLCMEQISGHVDGDSAASTELYALLSSLSGFGINQGIAVTGSMNQNGEVTVIGGVNHKIEGWFDVCEARGLTGEQGVIIPAGNVDNLMLTDRVIEAVKKGKFHIWSVGHVNQGIEILTGEKIYTINKRINDRLEKQQEREKEKCSE